MVRSIAPHESVASENINFGFTVAGPAVGGRARLAVERSTAFASGNEGFLASSSGGPAVLVITHSQALDGSQSGIRASGMAATLIVSGSTSARNAHYGFEQDDSAILTTLQNNTVLLNGLAPTSGTISTATVQ